MSGVVGVDLSLTSTGLCHIDAGAIVSLGNVRSKGRRGDTWQDREKRLYALLNEVVEWVEARDPDLVVIEAPSYGSQHGAQHDRSGLWWMVNMALVSDGYATAKVAPQARAKYGTGAGNSKKDVVFAFVKEIYQPLTSERISNDDIADAVILSAMGARHLGHPVELVEPSEAVLASLTGVLWPAV